MLGSLAARSRAQAAVSRRQPASTLSREPSSAGFACVVYVMTYVMNHEKQQHGNTPPQQTLQHMTWGRGLHTTEHRPGSDTARTCHHGVYAQVLAAAEAQCQDGGRLGAQVLGTVRDKLTQLGKNLCIMACVIGCVLKGLFDIWIAYPVFAAAMPCRASRQVSQLPFPPQQGTAAPGFAPSPSLAPCACSAGNELPRPHTCKHTHIQKCRFIPTFSISGTVRVQ